MRLPTRTLSLIGAGAVMLGLCASGVGTAAVAVDPVTYTVPTPYDDLTDVVCNGSPQTTSRISTSEGENATAMWALAGDTIEYIGSIKSCQLLDQPGDALEFGYEEAELDWRLRLPGQTISQAQPVPTARETVQDGRTAVPSLMRLTSVADPAHDGARLYFGAFDAVESPNGAGTVSGTTSIVLHVLDPELSLTKEVCVFDTAAECDVNNDAAWVPSTQIVSGADVFWRLTATNTGNIALNNIKVSGDSLANGTSSSNSCVGADVVASLDPTQSASIVCTTPALKSGGTATNTAKLTSNFVDPSPTQSLAARFPNGVESNEASAEVVVLNPAVSLVKEVCVTGSKCDPAVDADWTSSSVVKVDSKAVWRLTASNTGNTVLTSVKPSFEELSGAMSGQSAACTALDFGTLKVNESRSLTCETESITDTKQATVNTAAVSGVPADNSGTPLSQFTGTVESEQVKASVIAATVLKKNDPDPADPTKKTGPTKKTDPINTAANTATNPAAQQPGATGLATTGTETFVIVAAAALLLVAGTGALFVRRRRA